MFAVIIRQPNEISDIFVIQIPLRKSNASMSVMWNRDRKWIFLIGSTAFMWSKVNKMAVSAGEMLVCWCARHYSSVFKTGLRKIQSQDLVYSKHYPPYSVSSIKCSISPPTREITDSFPRGYIFCETSVTTIIQELLVTWKNEMCRFYDCRQVTFFRKISLIVSECPRSVSCRYLANFIRWYHVADVRVWSLFLVDGWHKPQILK